MQADQLIVATTTSLNDSGLLEDVVLPAYAELFPGVTVKVVAVGSGEALAMGAKGEADVLMVHSPDDEARFMADGDGTLRLPFAYNYFVSRVADLQSEMERFASELTGIIRREMVESQAERDR